MAEYAREEINSIGGYYAYGKELVNGGSVFDYDVTKLSVYTLEMAWRALRCMIFCGTSTISRLNLEISAISWPIFPSGTAAGH